MLAAAVSVSGLRLARSVAGRRAAAIRRALGGSLRDEFLAAVFRVGPAGGGSDRRQRAAGGAGPAVSSSLRGGTPVRRGAGPPAGGLPEGRFLVALLAVALAEAAPLLDTLRTRRQAVGMARFAVPHRMRTVPPTLALGVAAATVILVATAVLGGSAWRLFAGRGGYSDRGLAQITVDFGGHSGGGGAAAQRAGGPARSADRADRGDPGGRPGSLRGRAAG